MILKQTLAAVILTAIICQVSMGQVVEGTVVNLQSIARNGVDVTIRVTNRLGQDALDETALAASGKKIYDEATAKFYIPVDTAALLENDKRVKIVFEGPALERTVLGKLSGLETHDVFVIVPDAKPHCDCRYGRRYTRRHFRCW